MKKVLAAPRRFEDTLKQIEGDNPFLAGTGGLDMIRISGLHSWKGLQSHFADGKTEASGKDSLPPDKLPPAHASTQGQCAVFESGF